MSKSAYNSLVSFCLRLRDEIRICKFSESLLIQIGWSEAQLNTSQNIYVWRLLCTTQHYTACTNWHMAKYANIDTTEVKSSMFQAKNNGHLKITVGFVGMLFSLLFPELGMTIFLGLTLNFQAISGIVVHILRITEKKSCLTTRSCYLLQLVSHSFSMESKIDLLRAPPPQLSCPDCMLWQVPPFTVTPMTHRDQLACVISKPTLQIPVPP